MKSLMVFSHLRWDFVYQRPQHLISRFARYYRIFFIEEPVHTTGASHWQYTTAAANLTICRPHTPVDAAGFHDLQLPSLRVLMEELQKQFDIRHPLAWVYTPMALPLMVGLQAELVIYDCMDELSAFKQAPRQLVQRESAMFKIADLVFTGGPSLFQAKRNRHHSVHCFPSSVDREHFAAASDPGLEAGAQRHLPHPRLGFFGVIDERLDVQLLGDLAATHPDWQIVMVGPVVKIDPSTLPRGPNLHYFGQQPYAALPQYLAGWDVCLLPFAMNESTRFISPTKTLEYMAAEKPIVSTPVLDVAEPYGHIVRIGTGAEFIEQCELALRESSEERSQRVCATRATLGRTSWEQTVAQMQALILAAGSAKRSNEPRSAASVEPDAIASPAQGRHRVVVMGAGPTGLSAAYHIGEDCLLLEKNRTIGGWCRSIEDRGFTFDHAGHIMFSNDPYVHQLYEMLLGDNVHWQDREAWVYSKDVHTRYPFQGALYGLPPDVVSECIVGAVEARVGPLKNLGEPGGCGASTADSPSAARSGAPTDCCADGSSESVVPLVPHAERSHEAPRNFEEFIFKVWGKGIAKHFAIPYNRKLWAVPLSSMETSWLGGRVPVPDLREMIDGALRPVPKPLGPNARFGYPLKGGFQALMDGFRSRLRGPLQLEAEVIRVIPSRHRVVLADGGVHCYEQLISTTPLPLLVKMAGEEAPPNVRAAASRLRHVSVRCVNLGIGRPNLTEKHWIYYPEASPVFHRIFVQGNASPHCNAPGGFALTCEITYSPQKPLPCEGDALIDRCIEDCIKVGIIAADDPILARNQVDMPYAYVVYDHARAENVATIRAWAKDHDILLAGRYSEWEYYNSDHAFIAGRKAAEQAMAALREPRTGGEREADTAEDNIAAAGSGEAREPLRASP
jgi:protoporphyrinogen oxidase/glycosyltransferase involved in cell wall biosynthesis